MKKIFILIMALSFLTALAAADIHIKAKLHTDAFTAMGQSQPEKNEVIEQWIGDDHFALHSQDYSIIIDLKKNLTYFIDHKEKSYIEATLPLDLSKIMPPEMMQMMAMMKMTVTVNPTGQTKIIGPWKCFGYDVNMSMMAMSIKMTLWASTDLPFNVDQFMNKYNDIILRLQLRFIDEQSLAEFRKIKGYQVAYEQTMDIMGNKVSSAYEVTEIRKATPPPTVYTVPAGYQKSEKLKMMR